MVNLKTNDYQDFSHTVYLENTTTRTHIYLPGKIRIVSLGDKEVSLGLPKRSCSIGHSLTLYIAPKNLREHFTKLTPEERRELIVVTVKVNTLEALEGDIEFCDTDIREVQEALWKEFIKQFAERQRALSEIVTRMSD